MTLRDRLAGKRRSKPSRGWWSRIGEWFGFAPKRPDHLRRPKAHFRFGILSHFVALFAGLGGAIVAVLGPFEYFGIIPGAPEWMVWPFVALMIVVGLPLGILPLYAVQYYPRLKERLWRRVLRKLGYALVNPTWKGSATGSAKVIGVDLQSEETPAGATVGEVVAEKVQLSVAKTGNDSLWIAPNLEDSMALVRREQPDRSSPGAVGTSAGFRSHDPDLDDMTRFAGPPDHLCAALDAPTRTALIDALGRLGVRMEAGKLVLPLQYTSLIDIPPRIRRELQRLNALLHAFHIPAAEVPARLLGIVNTDPLPAVAVGAFEALRQHHPESAETQAAEEALRKSTDSVLRLGAARVLGAEGVDLLDAILANMTLPFRVRREAVRLRVALLEPASRGPALDTLLANPSGAVALGALEAALELGVKPSLASVAEAFKKPDKDRVVAGAALMSTYEARSVDVTAVESTLQTPEILLHELFHASLAARESPRGTWDARWDTHTHWLFDPPGPLLAILDALESVGTAYSVPLLKSLHEDADATLRTQDAHALIPRRARKVLQVIQAKLVGAQAGQLSLINPAEGEGALSLSDQAGELSMFPTVPELEEFES